MKYRGIRIAFSFFFLSFSLMYCSEKQLQWPVSLRFATYDQVLNNFVRKSIDHLAGQAFDEKVHQLFKDAQKNGWSLHLQSVLSGANQFWDKQASQLLKTRHDILFFYRDIFVSKQWHALSKIYPSKEDQKALLAFVRNRLHEVKRHHPKEQYWNNRNSSENTLLADALMVLKQSLDNFHIDINIQLPFLDPHVKHACLVSALMVGNTCMARALFAADARLPIRFAKQLVHFADNPPVLLLLLRNSHKLFHVKKNRGSNDFYTAAEIKDTENKIVFFSTEDLRARVFAHALQMIFCHKNGLQINVRPKYISYFHQLCTAWARANKGMAVKKGLQLFEQTQKTVAQKLIDMKAVCSQQMESELACIALQLALYRKGEIPIITKQQMKVHNNGSSDFSSYRCHCFDPKKSPQ